RLRPRLLRATLAAATAAALAVGPATAQPMILPPVPAPAPAPAPAFADLVGQVAAMTGDGELTSMAASHGLGIIDLLWEDTGRWEGSSVGPNISDVTIEVETAAAGAGGERQTTLMPVLRHDNFSDTTADVRLDRIYVPVGNAKGGPLQTISLRDLLAHPARYLSLPRVGHIQGGSLLAERDTHALVSAQHAFLPVPKEGKVAFWPVIFNYQSSAKNPAVLTILVTRQGTSMTIIDNQRDTLASSWGQRLYFNDHGKRAPLIAERLKDVQAKGTTANGESAASLGDDANLLMLIQVPLRYREPAYVAGYGGEALDGAPMPSPPPPSMAMASSMAPAAGAAMATGDVARSVRREADVDTAVLGHGPSEGHYTELDGLTIERDPRFPVRVTVQFYQATSTGVVTDADLARMAAQIDKVYARGDYVGSLVVPAPGDRARPTRWTGASPAPTAVSIGWFPGLMQRWNLK
ncbi:MAG TPA: hypothetical protein VHE35_14950, partial [Kofleriaceae bacterium]|nr:hypothetical protein [Kofleriaceae bacterium]